MIDTETPHRVATHGIDPDGIARHEDQLDADVNGHGGPALAAAVGFGLIGGAAAGVALVGAAGLVAAGVAYGAGYAQGAADSNEESTPKTTKGQ